MIVYDYDHIVSTHSLFKCNVVMRWNRVGTRDDFHGSSAISFGHDGLYLYLSPKTLFIFLFLFFYDD